MNFKINWDFLDILPEDISVTSPIINPDVGLNIRVDNELTDNNSTAKG